MKTAVEYLVHMYTLQGFISLHDIEQALEMEKDQMIEFTDNYVDNCVIPNENMAIPTIMDVPQYYNETFKQEEQ